MGLGLGGLGFGTGLDNKSFTRQGQATSCLHACGGGGDGGPQDFSVTPWDWSLTIFIFMLLFSPFQFVLEVGVSLTIINGGERHTGGRDTNLSLPRLGHPALLKDPILW